MLSPYLSDLTSSSHCSHNAFLAVPWTIFGMFKPQHLVFPVPSALNILPQNSSPVPLLPLGICSEVTFYRWVSLRPPCLKLYTHLSLNLPISHSAFEKMSKYTIYFLIDFYSISASIFKIEIIGFPFISSVYGSILLRVVTQLDFLNEMHHWTKYIRTAV